jgi:hypothetical protein
MKKLIWNPRNQTLLHHWHHDANLMKFFCKNALIRLKRAPNFVEESARWGFYIYYGKVYWIGSNTESWASNFCGKKSSYQKWRLRQVGLKERCSEKPPTEVDDVALTMYSSAPIKNKNKNKQTL